jgi:hypothetical protein
MNNQSFFEFIIIEMFVFDVVVKYIRLISEFRDVEKLERMNSRDLREQINRLLDQEMNLIIAFNAWKEKQQLHEKIIIYENFIQMKYFDQLKEYSDNIVNSIRHDIRQILQNYLLLIAEFEHKSAALSFLSFSLFNCLVSVLRSSSLKKIEIMFKSKRISLIVSTVENEELSCHAIALRHEVSRMIIRRRLKEKRTMKEFSKNRQLLFEQEETIILKFVNQFTELRFLLRYYMIEEKVILLLRKRRISNRALRQCYVPVFSTSTPHLSTSPPLSIRQAYLTVLVILQSIESLDSLIMLKLSANELKNEQEISDESFIERFSKRFISWYSHHDLKTT